MNSTSSVVSKKNHNSNNNREKVISHLPHPPIYPSNQLLITDPQIFARSPNMTAELEVHRKMEKHLKKPIIMEATENTTTN